MPFNTWKNLLQFLSKCLLGRFAKEFLNLVYAFAEIKACERNNLSIRLNNAPFFIVLCCRNDEKRAHINVRKVNIWQTERVFQVFNILMAFIYKYCMETVKIGSQMHKFMTLLKCALITKYDRNICLNM